MESKNNTNTKLDNYRNIENNPAYFTLYLNKATANIFHILNHISDDIDEYHSFAKKKNDLNLAEHSIFGFFDLKPSKESKDITSKESKDITLDNKYIEILEKLWYLLCKHFTFLKSYEYNKVYLTRRLSEKEKLSKASKIKEQEYLVVNENAQLQQKELDIKWVVKNRLKLLINILQHLRNYFTHYQESDIGFFKYFEIKPSKPEFWEVSKFDAVLRNIWDKGILKASNQFEQLPLSRFEHLIKELNNYKYDYHFIKKENDSNNKEKLDIKGLTFLICLFLEKKDAYQFLGKIKGFKHTGSKKDAILTHHKGEKAKERKSRLKSVQHRATLCLYTIYCCKTPKPVLEMSNENKIVDLINNLVNELVKCPKELFDMLSKEDKEKFACFINLDKIGNIEYNLAEQQREQVESTDYNDFIHKTYLIRYQDRFPYLALRFIEKTKLFPSLKFHIDLGKVSLKHSFENDKGTGYKHQWYKNVYTFGELDFFKKQKSKINGYKYFSPHYHINQGNIQFTFIDGDGDDFIPKVIKNTTKLAGNGNATSKTIKSLTKFKNIELKFNISVYDLAAVVFWGLKRKERRIISLRKILNDMEKNYRNFIDCVATGNFTSNNYDDFGEKLKTYQLQRNWIPKEIKKALAKKSVCYKQVVEDKIEEELKTTRNLIENAEQRYPKIGKMADFLVKDIVKRMLPKSEIKADISAKKYKKLQRIFALFETHKRTHKDFLENDLKILTGKKSERHPFLYEVKKFDSLKDFYSDYLTKKEYFLKVLKGKLPSVDKADRYPFLRIPYIVKNGKKVVKTYDLEYLKHIKNRCNNDKLENTKPFVVPKGFLNKHIDNLIEGYRNPKSTDHKQVYNFVYTLINEINKNKCQEFYDFNRVVKIYTDSNSLKKSKLIQGNPKQLAERYNEKIKDVRSDKKFVGKSKLEKYLWSRKIVMPEKIIRQYKAQDIMIFEMAKYLIKNHLDKNFKMDELNNLSLQNLQSGLDYQINLSLKIGCVEVNGKFSLKKYGNVKALFNHKRVIELLKYLESCGVKKIDYNTLIDLNYLLSGSPETKNCLKPEFPIYGEQAFKYFIKLEKLALCKGYTIKESEIKNGEAIKFRLAINYLFENMDISKKDDYGNCIVNKIICYRNMCCHSGFIKEKEKNTFINSKNNKLKDPKEIVKDINKQITSAIKLFPYLLQN
ncbi:MAG: type VI-B CRISPR-associated RNA-guided ribonuclease Cas13b [Tenacibaculum sp.]